MNYQFTTERVIAAPEANQGWHLGILCPRTAITLPCERRLVRDGRIVFSDHVTTQATLSKPMYVLPHPRWAGCALFFLCHPGHGYLCSCSWGLNWRRCEHLEPLFALLRSVPILGNLREGHWLYCDGPEQGRCTKLPVDYVQALFTGGITGRQQSAPAERRKRA